MIETPHQFRAGCPRNAGDLSLLDGDSEHDVSTIRKMARRPDSQLSRFCLGTEMILGLKSMAGHCLSKWRREEQNELWIGRHGRPNAVTEMDPSLVSRDVLLYVHLPPGHQESWADAFLNLIRDAYQWIRERGHPEAKAAPPTFEDSYRSTCIVETMLKSNAAGGRWENVQP